MKQFITMMVCVLAFSGSTQAENNFPSYLTENYCESIKLDFMTGAVKSLQNYRDKQLSSQHRGGMRNIQKYLKQRQDWLQECDSYLSATSEHKRLFKDDDTTTDILDAIQSINNELGSLISGVIYASENPTEHAEAKFDELFKLVENHQTHLLMRGQVVYR